MKAEWAKWRELLERYPAMSLRRDVALPLLDYVDTLETAAKRAAGIAAIMSYSNAREIYQGLSAALDKGK